MRLADKRRAREPCCDHQTSGRRAPGPGGPAHHSGRSFLGGSSSGFLLGQSSSLIEGRRPKNPDGTCSVHASAGVLSVSCDRAVIDRRYAQARRSIAAAIDVDQRGAGTLGDWRLGCRCRRWRRRRRRDRRVPSRVQPVRLHLVPAVRRRGRPIEDHVARGGARPGGRVPGGRLPAIRRTGAPTTTPPTDIGEPTIGEPTPPSRLGDLQVDRTEPHDQEDRAALVGLENRIDARLEPGRDQGLDAGDRPVPDTWDRADR